MLKIKIYEIVAFVEFHIKTLCKIYLFLLLHRAKGLNAVTIIFFYPSFYLAMNESNRF